MLRKLKILIITPSVPYPPNRGDKLRIFNIIKTLIKRHNVKVLAFTKGKDELNYVEQLRKKGIEIETIQLSKIKSYINLLLGIFSGKPLQVLFYFNKNAAQKIAYLTSIENFDVVYFHIFTTIQYKNYINADSLKVVDLTDAYSLYLERLLEFEKKFVRRLFFKIEKKLVDNYIKTLETFDTVFVCSEVDKKFLENFNPKLNIEVFENGIDTNIYHYKFTEPERHRIIFTGNLPYFPNSDAVKYFVSDIFPYVLKVYPDSKLYIVGKDPTPDIIRLESKNVIVKGFVEDLVSEYLKSEVNIAPLRVGSGTSNKIVEALCLGIPTVSTSLAVSGFNEKIKKYVFVADDAEAFAKKIINIFDDKSIRMNFMREASENVTKLLNLDTVVDNIENSLVEKINRQNKK